MKLTLSSLLVGATFNLIAATVNLTILVYGTMSPALLSSISMSGPGVDMAIEKMTRVYGYNFTRKYIGPFEARSCQELARASEYVGSYYYREHDHRNPLVLAIPGCDESVPLARLAREWNVLLLSSAMSNDNLWDKANYPTTISTAPVQLSMFAEVFLELFKYYKWRSITLLCDKGAPVPSFNIWQASFETLMERNQANAILHEQRFNSRNETDYFKLLSDVRKVSRIVIISAMPSVFRQILLVASSLNMTNGEYVYFTVEALRNKRVYGNLTWQNYDANDEIAKEAFRSVMQLLPCYNEAQRNVTFNSELIRRSRDYYNYTYPKGEPPNPVVYATYQAVDMLGDVVSRVMVESGDLFNGRLLASKFLNHSFHLSSETVYMDERGERRSDYCVNAMNPETFLLERVIKYDVLSGSLIPLEMQIDWGNDEHQPPMNEPKCGYLGHRCFRQGDNTLNTIAAPTLSAAAFVLVVLVAVIVIGRRQAFFVANRWWIIENEELGQACCLVTEDFVSRASLMNKSTIATTSLRGFNLDGIREILSNRPEYPPEVADAPSSC